MSHDTTNTAARSAATASAGQHRAGEIRVSLLQQRGTAYCRARDLPRLVALWPDEATSTDAAVRVRVLGKLRAALRAERRRGLAGHWSYDLARHSQLYAAYRNELEELQRRQIGGHLDHRG